jgi:hypothetical protein
VRLLLLAASLLLVLAVACRASSDGRRGAGDAAPPEPTPGAGVHFEAVYRGLATLRLLVEDRAGPSRQFDDSSRYVDECAEMPGGCNLESFRLFYANTPEGAARAYQEARRACRDALEPDGSAGAQREALAEVCPALPGMVLSSALFDVDVAALDAAIATLAAVAN